MHPAPPRPRRPPTTGRRRTERWYLAALFIDSVGTGLWTPLALIFFTRAQHLPLDATGGALTAGGLVGLLTGPISGILVDRWGALPLVMISNVARAAVFLAYPLVTSVWQLALLAAVFSACERLFWTANTPALEKLVAEGELLRAYGLQNMLRTVGWLVGAGLAAVLSAALFARPERMHLVAWLNGLTFLVAALMMTAVRSPRRPPEPKPAGPLTADPAARSAWKDILTDRTFLTICSVHLAFALMSDSLTVMLPLVALDVLHGPSWLPGAALIAGSLSLLLVQKRAVRYGHRSPLRALRLACAAFALAFAVLAPAGGAAAGWAVPVVLGAALVGTTGDALFAPVTTVLANDAAPAALKGRYSATFQLAWGAAAVLAPAVGAVLLTVGNTVLWSALAVLSAVTAVLTRLLPGDYRR